MVKDISKNIGKYISVQREGDHWVCTTESLAPKVCTLTNIEDSKTALLVCAGYLGKDIDPDQIEARFDYAFWPRKEPSRYGCLCGLLVILLFWVLVIWGVLCIIS